MRSLVRRFDNYQKKFPYSSDYIAFKNTIRGQKFSYRTISHHYRTLVNTDEYAASTALTLIKQLVEESNDPEECMFGENFDDSEAEIFIPIIDIQIDEITILGSNIKQI
jgi:hypothetical protein